MHGVDHTSDAGLVLRHLAAQDATTLELETRTGRPRVNISPLMKPLERAGFVRRTPRRRGLGIVWEITDKGRIAIR